MYELYVVRYILQQMTDASTTWVTDWSTFLSDSSSLDSISLSPSICPSFYVSDYLPNLCAKHLPVPVENICHPTRLPFNTSSPSLKDLITLLRQDPGWGPRRVLPLQGEGVEVPLSSGRRRVPPFPRAPSEPQCLTSHRALKQGGGPM